MRSLREPIGATIAAAYSPGPGLALGAAVGSSMPLGTADVTPNGVYGFSFWQPSHPPSAIARPSSASAPPAEGRKVPATSGLFPILIINVEAAARLPAEQAGLDQ